MLKIFTPLLTNIPRSAFSWRKHIPNLETGPAGTGEFNSRPLPNKITWFEKDEPAYQAMKEFKPREDDVIIATIMKSGTNLCIQICHNLRKPGHTDFEHVSDDNLCPFLETSYHLNQDLTQNQVAHPRLFKTHLSFTNFNGTGKYLTTTRDPMKAYKSAQNFLKFKLNLSFEEFSYMKAQDKNDNIWELYVDQWKAYESKKDNILTIAYEDMLKDDIKRVQVERIAKFINIPNINKELIDTVMHMSSRQEMMKLNDAFGTNIMYKRFREANRDTVWIERMKKERGERVFIDGMKSKMVTDGEHQKEKPSQEILEFFEYQWDTQVTKKIGFKTYKDLCNAIEEVNKTRF